MSFAQTVLLGALAGFTIYLGLPVARLRLLSSRARVGLAMFAVGILAFIFVDVMEHGFGIVEEAVEGYKEHGTGFGHMIGLAALLVGGFGAGSAGLGMIERRVRPARQGDPGAPAAGARAEAGGGPARPARPPRRSRVARPTRPSRPTRRCGSRTT